MANIQDILWMAGLGHGQAAKTCRKPAAQAEVAHNAMHMVIRNRARRRWDDSPFVLMLLDKLFYVLLFLAPRPDEQIEDFDISALSDKLTELIIVRRIGCATAIA